MFIFGLPGVISAFFADRQLLLFAAAPISSLQLFLARLLQASIPAALVGIVVLTSVFAYGVGAGLNPAFGLLAIFLIAALALTVVSFEVCLMSLVLRVVPATRARDVAGIMLALLGSSFYVLQILLRGPVEQLTKDPNQSLQQVTGLSSRLAWLPTSWPAEALAAWAFQGPVAALGWTALTFAVAAVAVVAGWFLHQQSFVLGIGVFGEAGGGSTRRRRSRAPAATARTAAPNPIAAIAKKDALALRRDFRRLAGALPAVAMAVAYTFLNSGHLPAGWAFWGIALPIGFVPGIVGLAVALPAVGTEGRGMQLVALAGLPMRTFLLAKLVFAVPIILGLTLAMSVALLVIWGAGLAESAEILLFGAWLAAVGSAVAVAAGAIGPNFSAADPRRGISTGWAMGGMLVMAVFFGLSYGALGAVWFAAAGRLTAFLVPLGILLLALAAAVVGGMLVAGLTALERWRPGE
jgi:Putative ATP-binding cassette